MRTFLRSHKKKFLISLGYITASVLLSLPFAFRAVTSNSFAADAVPQVLSVSNIGTVDLPVFTLIWPKSDSSVLIERGVGETFETLYNGFINHYIDYTAKQGIDYTYRVTTGGKTLTSSSAQILSGKSQISNIRIDAGATSKTESSLVIKFSTDRMAKSQVFYGESASYGSQTELGNALNQSHTIMIEKLKTNTTYHFKIRVLDLSGENITESTDQTFTTTNELPEQTILQVIIDALSKAFGNFSKWFNS